MRGRGSWAAGILRKQAGGKTAVLRRSNNLSAAAVTAAAAASGATSVLLVSATSARLTGRVVAGSQFVIAGVSGTYATLSDAEAQGSGSLEASLSPPLASDAASGAAVTFSRPFAETPYPFIVRQISAVDKRALASSTLAVPQGESVRVLPFDAEKPAPRTNDRLDGVAIVRVDEIPADDGLAGYMCHMDSGSAA